jgi:hypothetical protein
MAESRASSVWAECTDRSDDTREPSAANILSLLCAGRRHEDLKCTALGRSCGLHFKYCNLMATVI